MQTSTIPRPTGVEQADRTGSATGRGTSERILLVEDIPTQAEKTRAVLESAGWSVATCASGSEAVAATTSTMPDLILLDMHLPGLNGREVARRLKADPLLAVIPIIFLTSVFGEVEHIIGGLDDGADDYLMKTVSDEELIARVRASLRARKTERALGRLARLLMSVNQVGSRLAGILDLDDLLESATRLLHGTLNYTHVSLLLLDAGGLTLSASAGAFADDLLDGPLHLPLDGKSPVAASVRGRRTIHATRPDDDSRPLEHPLLACIRSIVAVPLTSAGEVVGALEVVSPSAGAFDEADTLALETIADLLGVAVENSRLYRRMESLAMTDELTGLLNRRAILDRLEAEWGRSVRHSRPMTLLSLDVDAFKAVNDRHGHATGDAAIEAVSQSIRRAIRLEDLGGRLGGDEFLIILPETGPAGGLEVAERLRAAVGALSIRSTVDGGAVPLGLSIGVAGWPEVAAADADALMRASDQALYRAKAAGRNRASF